MKPDTSHPLRRKQIQEACERALIGFHIICMGNWAGLSGKAISTCPKLPPQLRKVWLSGWRCGRKEHNMWDRAFKAIPRGRRP